MELLIGLLMNILGADLYDRCPRLARFLIRKAAARLPEGKRESYAEEWSSHLADCDTKLDQLRHALGCWWSVGGILRTEPQPKRAYSLDALILGSGLMLVGSTAEAIMSAMAGAPWLYLVSYLFQILPGAFVVVLGIRMRLKDGRYVYI
ncbi:hypothetical protein MKK70_18150 [Methylobacterium sp. E-041]|jgi:hypothetical protein|uniref:hypothetical protein n=1 Tax=unclassified Methylobacterium TaxID=2615210 RepID=UPI0007015116|nr:MULTISPECIES: hypothetical protein [unclassified Methylobacterium]KQP15478.1 hypothetical protein ASF26_17320 [Methylobacterium sp. Leaf93]MCJ2020892.1 hypothetical protein [Methylobacterium sp. E-065]MCJ2077544.1 hypothetical protein [Methylobacterium sp. E-016]MCJ2107270.1 hypothetical protein [Methylobacterium sp. E-041]MCJ2116140.1 hypothetical protein [Methylobacterium sp. J-001]